MKTAFIAAAILTVCATGNAHAMCANVPCADVVFSKPIPMFPETSAPATAPALNMALIQQATREPSKQDAPVLENTASLGDLAPSAGGECKETLKNLLTVCGM